MFVNGCVAGWLPPGLGGYWSALAQAGQSESSMGQAGLSHKGKSGHGSGHAYELLGLLHRQAHSAGLGVSPSYPGLPPPHSYAGYVLSYAHAHRPFSPPTSASGSGLAPLQKLCSSDSSAFKSLEECGGTLETAGPTPLKFGISRILDDDFGKSKQEKGIVHTRT